MRPKSHSSRAAEGLVRAQTNLMNDIEERLSATTFSVELRSDPEVQKVAELLRQAVERHERSGCGTGKAGAGRSPHA